jgi:hypothetical protein
MKMTEVKAYRLLVQAFRGGLTKKEKESLREMALKDLMPICCGARGDRYIDEGGE